MSTIQDKQANWTNLASQQLDSKYEKCRNITEEIYKRINITFQIKKLETGDQSDISDNSDQIDSNEFSNETDLFACDKSDISSSTEAEKAGATSCLPTYINNNNNEDRNKPQLYKKPRKRFRKRVKKRPPNRKRSDSEGSSDEAPLSRSVLILTPDLKPKSPIDNNSPKKSSVSCKNPTLKELLKPTEIKIPTVLIEKMKSIDTEAVKISEIIDKTTDNSVTTIDKKKPEKSSKTAISKIIESVTSIDKKIANVMGIYNSKEMRNIEVPIDKDKVLSMTELDKKKLSKDVKITDWKSCDLCTLSFRGERGLRRHMSMSHIVEANK